MTDIEAAHPVLEVLPLQADSISQWRNKSLLGETLALAVVSKYIWNYTRAIS
jgi:hypothetical protein